MINSLHYDYYHSYSHYGNYYRLIKWPLMVNINDKKISHNQNNHNHNNNHDNNHNNNHTNNHNNNHN